MSGTRDGGKKAAIANRERHGADYYKRIGAIGGKRSQNGGFASDKVGKDGLTGAERARIAGAKGGARSKRGPAKHKAMPHVTNEEVRESKEKGGWKWPFLGRRNG